MYPEYPFPTSTDLWPQWAFAALPHVDADVAVAVAQALQSPAFRSSNYTNSNVAGFGLPKGAAAAAPPHRPLASVWRSCERFEHLTDREHIAGYIVQADLNRASNFMDAHGVVRSSFSTPNMASLRRTALTRSFLVGSLLR